MHLKVKKMKSAARENCSSIDKKKWVVNGLKLVMKEVSKQRVMHGLVQFPSVQSHWAAGTVLLGRQWIRQRQSSSYG